MTQDEIIEMARQAGFMPAHDNRVQRFAKLVAAKSFQDGFEKGMKGFVEAVNLEREEIVKDFMARHEETKHSHNFWHVAANQVKARGQNDTR